MMISFNGKPKASEETVRSRLRLAVKQSEETVE
jgi:hypothetical protein